jgi:hypothetical protein
MCTLSCLLLLHDSAHTRPLAEDNVPLPQLRTVLQDWMPQLPPTQCGVPLLTALWMPQLPQWKVSVPRDVSHPVA